MLVQHASAPKPAPGGLLKLWLEGSYVAPVRVTTGGIRAKTHLALIHLNTRLVTAYVKAFEAGHDRLLFNEAAGGLLARHAVIGCPQGGLLWVPLSVLKSLFSGSQFASHGGLVPCYASAPVDNGYGLAAVGLGEATGAILEVMRRLLLDWPAFAACVAFDEWVANIDRHANNLLIAAGGRLVPIDHSDCFGGPDSHDPEFSGPNAWYCNKLLESIFDPEHLPLPIKAQIVHSAEHLPDCYKQCAADLEALRPWLGEPRGGNWLQWTQMRATMTAQLLRERVRMLV